MHKLQIIIGSTRETRAAERVYPWVLARAAAHPDFEPELVDLRDWPLPLFGEHFGTIGDLDDPTYSDPLVKRWNELVKEGDAYLAITPEYNHSIPGVLKNAFDNVFVSFALRNKPMAAVGYSSGIAGGARAVEHLAHVAIEADMAPLRSSVLIPFVNEAFDSEGAPLNPMTDVALAITLDDLAWWAGALKAARGAGQLPPAGLRARAATAAAAASG
ncbi:MAG TPA: NAD(P)H-dependent oxidoreductase [Acidimicrobiales bacterium]|nr:NAD(P)H-dependent oxidoreductase [Acidimicrobiales bacterium]